MTHDVAIGMTTRFHAERDPKRPFVTIDGRTVSRSEFEARANRRARSLQAVGVSEGDFVSMLLPNTLEFVETTFALWKLGATPAPLAPGMPQGELDTILGLLQPKLIVTSEPRSFDGLRTISVDRPLDESLSPDALPELTPRYWRATTSGGSTGRPKVIVSHGFTRVNPLQPTMKRKLDGVQLNTGPLYHSGPFSNGFGSLFYGAHLVDAGKFDPLRVLELVERYKVDWIYLVPTMMQRIMRLSPEDRARFDLSSLDVVFHMAAPCPVWLKQAWIEWIGPERIWELYSGTESPGVTIINGLEWLDHKGSVGRVQPGSQMLVLNAENEPCPPGEVGEIYFLPNAGKGATYHYIGAEAKAFGEWESLGDLGYIDADGYLYVVDRRTDMIVSGGVNIYPAEVEAALDAHPSTQCSVVVGLPDDDFGSRVHAIVELRPGMGAPAEPKLREFLAERLMRHKIPKTFEFVEAPLRDAAGKVRRSALREQRVRASGRT